MVDTPARLRETLDSLRGDDDTLIRTAARLALRELDLADDALDPAPHFVQVGRLLDAVLHPDDGHHDR